MSTKTAAELQLEFLKKLKEQQKSAPSRPRPDGSTVPKSPEKSLSIRELKRRPSSKSGRRIPLSEAAWRKLKEEGINTGKLKWNQALGDRAVELLLKFADGGK